MKKDHPASKAFAKNKINEIREILQGEREVNELEEKEMLRLTQIEEDHYLRRKREQATKEKITPKEKEKVNYDYRQPYKD